jgi:AcrR family transcriptional regulator
MKQATKIAVRFLINWLPLRFKRYLLSILPADSGPASASNYYVDRYLRPGYGTAAQLAQGLEDRRGAGRTPSDLLQRLVRAWHAMKRAADSVPAPFRVGGEWAHLMSEYFAPLTDALDRDDRAALNDLLQNFFRTFGDCFGEPTNPRHFRAYASRWIDLYGAEALLDACPPVIGNPMGFVVDGAFMTPDGFRHNSYARRMADLADDIEHPVVCEVGGGFGGFAYHLLNRGRSFKYIDYDLPVICIAAAHYLTLACPDKCIRLYGEVASLQEPLRDCDAAVLPNFVLPDLGDRAADICFNTCSFAEMDEATVKEYMRQFERVCRRFILLEDHAWTTGSTNAYYQPSQGFSHWDLSRIEPTRKEFKRVYKIPAPFHSDLFGEFFEWLYMRR